jgi:Integrase core domain
VGRIRRERWPSPPPPEAASGVPRAVRAKRPNHVWMVDLTDVKGLFGLVTFKVAVVFDAFSRMPLSVRVFSKEASAREIALFVSRATKRHGRLVHFISDHARCFTGQVFRRKLLRLEVKQRFGAVGRKGSIALIESLWRTLKDTLGLRLLRPSAAEDLAATVELGLVITPTSVRIGVLAGRHRPRSTSDGRQRISRRSRLLAVGRAKARWAHRFASGTSMRSGGCPCWFEKQPERAVTREKTSLDVCAHGGIVVAEALVCARQRPPQFPLRPYSPVYAYHVGKEVGLARDLTATFQKGGVSWIVCCAAALVLSFFLRETRRAAHPQPTPA